MASHSGPKSTSQLCYTGDLFLLWGDSCSWTVSQIYMVSFSFPPSRSCHSLPLKPFVLPTLPPSTTYSFHVWPPDLNQSGLTLIQSVRWQPWGIHEDGMNKGSRGFAAGLGAEWATYGVEHGKVACASLQVLSGLGMSAPNSFRASAVDLEPWFSFVNNH